MRKFFITEDTPPADLTNTQVFAAGIVASFLVRPVLRVVRKVANAVFRSGAYITSDEVADKVAAVPARVAVAAGNLGDKVTEKLEEAKSSLKPDSDSNSVETKATEDDLAA